MKKTLYSTTVLAAAGLLTLGASNAFAQAAAPAAPEKLKIAIGGFMNQHIGYVDQTANNAAIGYKHFDQKSDSEVHFSGSVKLDNGYTVSVMVQTETDRHATNGSSAATAGDWIDESYMRITGDIGEIRLGSGKAGSFSLGVQAPWVGALNHFNGDEGSWIQGPNTFVATNTNRAGIGSATFSGADDNNRVVYISPSFGGFRVGGSYAPSTTNSPNQPLVTEGDIYDVSGQYAGQVGAVGLRLYAGYWTVQNAGTSATGNSASTKTYSGGADVKFGDITVGGAYASTKDNETLVATANSQDVKNWNLGIAYKPGGYSIGLTYAASEAPATNTAGDDEHRRIALGATYDLGPGVTAVGTIMHHRTEDEAGNTANENKGWAVVTGVNVSF